MVTLRTSISDGASVLMTGSPGIGLLEFNIGMVKEYLDNGEKVIFVSLDATPTSILALMDEFGILTKDVLGKSLFIIDYHSSLLGNTEESPLFDKDQVLLVSDIEGIMFNIAGIVKDHGKPVRIFIYSLSTMFLYNQVNVVLKFFQISSSRIRNEFGTVIFSLHEGVHDEKTANHLMALADGLIELKFDHDLNRMMRIRHMRGMPSLNQWIPFEIRLADSTTCTHVLKWR